MPFIFVKELIIRFLNFLSKHKKRAKASHISECSNIEVDLGAKKYAKFIYLT
jgi:hypothetical protein